jgi:hypothetical protein
MFVIAAVLPLAEPLAEGLLGALAEELLELLQADTRMAATATPAARGTHLPRVNFIDTPL